MGRFVVTGSASGIGLAVRNRLEDDGHTVFGIDQHAVPGRSEAGADLSTAAGRQAAIDATAAWCRAGGAALDGVVTCAGVGPTVPDPAAIVAVNYFGTVLVLDGLRPLLAGTHPAAVAIASNSATIVPGVPDALVALCVAGDEPAALTLAASVDPAVAYAASKLAVVRRVRTTAAGPNWAGSGIRLNAVAPGATATPLLQQGLDDPVLGDLIRAFPIPIGGFATPEQIAGVIVFLLVDPAAACVCGSVWFADGGTDALVRGADSPTRL